MGKATWRLTPALVTWTPSAGRCSTGVSIRFSPSPSGLVNNDAVYAGTLDLNATLPWAKLTSITAYRGYDFYATTSPASNPATGGPNFLYSHPDHSRSFTQELRLANTEASGLAWVGGLFYSHESEPSTVRFDYINSDPAQNPVAFVNPPMRRRISLPAVNSRVPGRDRRSAVRCDATLPIVDRFRLRGGLRYTNERVQTALARWDHRL